MGCDGVAVLNLQSVICLLTTIGHFVDDYRHGFGKFTWDDGEYFEGEYKWGKTTENGTWGNVNDEKDKKTMETKK